MSRFHHLTDTQPAHVTALNLPQNTSCVLVDKRCVSIEPIPLPILQPDGVLVKVIANGICGSDMHVYLSGGIGGRASYGRTVMGHEAAGEVIAVGEFFALPADMAPHIPETVSWEEAGSIQPLAIGIQIGKRADLRAHQTVAIFGCGPIGLITAAVAHAYCAAKIIAFEINPSRAAFAKEYRSPITGRPIIDRVFHIEPIPTSDGQVQDAEEQSPGDAKWEHAKRRMETIIDECGLSVEDGVDRVVEASGAEDAMLHGVALCKQGGVFLQVGLGHIQTHTFPMVAVTNKELDVRGITRYTASCFPSAIDLLSRGVVDLKPLITSQFPLSRAKEAFEAVASGKEMKVIIKNQEI
ncbi:chaperonin 10-like protein [Aspergillus floccosus]